MAWTPAGVMHVLVSVSRCHVRHVQHTQLSLTDRTAASCGSNCSSQRLSVTLMCACAGRCIRGGAKDPEGSDPADCQGHDLDALEWPRSHEVRNDLQTTERLRTEQ